MVYKKNCVINILGDSIPESTNFINYQNGSGVVGTQVDDPVIIENSQSSMINVETMVEDTRAWNNSQITQEEESGRVDTPIFPRSATTNNQPHNNDLKFCELFY